MTQAETNVAEIAAKDKESPETMSEETITRLVNGKLTLEILNECKYWYIQNTDKRKRPLMVEFKDKDGKRILDYTLVSPERLEAGGFIDSANFPFTDGFKVQLSSSLKDAEIALGGLASVHP